MTVAKPFLKFAGGKTKLLPEILPRLPRKIKAYYEPFVGGGAVFFALAAEKRFEHAAIGDSNAELMNAYLAISTRVDQVIRCLGDYVTANNEKDYYDVRAWDPKRLTCQQRAARLIYLNRVCFNGLYRVNRKGQFNVPFGRYENPTICDEENLRAVSKALDTYLYTGDFEELVKEAKRGDTAYFDPPYWPLSVTSNFTGYSKDGFGFEDQTRLRDCFARLDKRGVHVLLSNSDTPLIRKLYKGFRIEEVQAPRRVNSKGAKRGNVTELLISGRR